MILLEKFVLKTITFWDHISVKTLLIFGIFNSFRVKFNV